MATAWTERRCSTYRCKARVMWPDDDPEKPRCVPCELEGR